jgi:mycothiol synthase
VAVTISNPTALDERERACVLKLAATIEASDGAPPLSDQARTQLGSDGVRHLVASDAGALAGYAQLSGIGAELLGTPASLGPLLDELQRAAPGLELWAHGARSRLAPVLDERGYERVRVLWQLRWPVTPLEPAPLHPGVELRPFVVGSDEAAWLRVNAAAFAHHPEQGGWTLADLQAREAELWFDPSGFLLAWSGEQLLGFHWTKRHSLALGEVYVIGVDPPAQGMTLGKSLLVAGLEHLRNAGAQEVLLYVDESNTTAMALYEKYGFQRFDHDTQYRYPSAF